MQANDRYLISCIFKSNNLSNKTWTPESNCLLNAALCWTSGCSGGYKGRVNRVMTSWPSPWDLGAPACRQGYHRPVRGTTGLSGRHRHIKDTTELSGVSPTYQGHHRLIRGTADLSRGTVDLSVCGCGCVGVGGVHKLLPMAPSVTAMAWTNWTLKTRHHRNKVAEIRPVFKFTPLPIMTLPCFFSRSAPEWLSWFTAVVRQCLSQFDHFPILTWLWYNTAQKKSRCMARMSCVLRNRKKIFNMQPRHDLTNVRLQHSTAHPKSPQKPTDFLGSVAITKCIRNCPVSLA